MNFQFTNSKQQSAKSGHKIWGNIGGGYPLLSVSALFSEKFSRKKWLVSWKAYHYLIQEKGLMISHQSTYFTFGTRRNTNDTYAHNSV